MSLLRKFSRRFKWANGVIAAVAVLAPLYLTPDLPIFQTYPTLWPVVALVVGLFTRFWKEELTQP